MTTAPACRNAFAALVAAALLAAAIVPRAARAQSTAESISIPVGKSALVEIPLPIERVSVGLGDVAIAMVTGPNEVLLNGKSPGVTSLIVWQQGAANSSMT